MKLSKLHALASSLAAYLLDQAGEHINGIYLFGSIARGDAVNDSDIDLFIDATRNQDNIKKAAEMFESTSAAKMLRAVGIKNPLRALVGNLKSKEFSDINLNIAADGIVLYGKGIPKGEIGKMPYLLIWFEAPQQQKKKVAFLRKVYGRTEQGRNYPGLMQKFNGFKAETNNVFIPITHKATFLSELKKAKIKYAIKNVWL